MKNILSVGFHIASDCVTHSEINSRTSLLDWDIVLFRPVFSARLFYDSGTYKGKPSLNDGLSFFIKESCEHWRREINEAVDSGKTVIVFLCAFNEFFIDTGDRQYSGTGRNQKATRIVALHSNYASVPLSSKLTQTDGTAMKLAPSAAPLLADYWGKFGAESKYHILLNAESYLPAVLTKHGEKTVGTIVRSKKSAGSLVLLPDLDFDSPAYLSKHDPPRYTDKAKEFATRLVDAVVSLDRKLRSNSEVSPEPTWAARESFATIEENELRASLLKAESKVEEAQRAKEGIESRLAESGALRGLLYESGKTLETATIKALKILGFAASGYVDSISEFDVVFECAEGRFIGEVEGKESKAINIEKFRQLSLNIQEDLSRTECATPAKGVLFGNGFRLTEPSMRGSQFTEKCIASAESFRYGLVPTSELFYATKYIVDSADAIFAGRCREAILTAAGLVAFPAVPEQSHPPSVDAVVDTSDSK